MTLFDRHERRKVIETEIELLNSADQVNSLVNIYSLSLSLFAARAYV